MTFLNSASHIIQDLPLTLHRLSYYLLAILAIKLTTVLPLFRFWNSDNFRFDSAGPRAPNSFYFFFRDDSAGPRAELILIFFS